MLDRSVRFVTYQSETDRYPAQQQLLYEELCALLEPEEVDCNPCPGKTCPQKFGMAWSPGFIPPEKTRSGGNVDFLDLICLDIDNASPESVVALCGRLEGLEVLIHSTHSHTPEKPRLRLILTPSRPILGKEWLAVWHAITEKYGISADKSAKDPCRIYFTARRPRGAPYVHVYEPGAAVNVEELLRSRMRNGAQRDAPPAGPVPEPGSVDLDGLKKFLRYYNPADDFDGSKRQLVRNILAGEPLAIENRNNAVHRAASILGWRFPVGTPFEAALEVMRESLSKIPPSDADGPKDNWDGWVETAHRSYSNKQEELKKKIIADNKDAASYYKHREEKYGKAKQQEEKAPTDTAVAQEEPAVSKEEVDGEAWRDDLIFKHLRGGIIVKEQGTHNVAVILKHHEQWKGALKFNEVTKDIDYVGGPVEGDASLRAKVSNWMQKHEGLNLSTKVIEEQIFLVGRDNSYDPLKNYLNGLIWDGVSRIDTWLENYCKAEVIDSRGNDVTRFVRKAGACWLIGAVARGLNPGCKVDSVLVMEGPQGAGKSTTLSILGGAWFSDTTLKLDEKDSRMLAAQSWVIELAELSAVRATETESQKAFFSQCEDKFRPPYGYKIEVFPRRCVFAGTTNRDTYLHDPTGNRRYWPVWCEEFDLEALRRDRDQLWAEAVHRYKSGESWWFEKADAWLVESITDQRLHSGPFTEKIHNWWSQLPIDKRPTAFTMLEVLEIIDVDQNRVDFREGVGRALKKLGFQKIRRRIDGFPTWFYEPTEKLMNLPVVPGRRLHLTIVQNTKPTQQPGEA